MRRRGFSLAETVAASAIAGTLAAAVVGVSAKAAVTRSLASQQRQAETLVASMASEVRETGFGSESSLGSGAAGPRSAFESLDEFNGWSSSPPRDADGVALDGSDGLTRTVSVFWRDPGTGGRTATPTGVKVVSIEVLRGASVLASAQVDRSVAAAGWWGETPPAPATMSSSDVLDPLKLLEDDVLGDEVELVQKVVTGVLDSGGGRSR
ncbi:MAG: type II secretion system protein [Planctomycetota bacterium]